jgi:ATP-dependent protease ClpP protease subunit
VAPQGVEDVAGQARFDERLNQAMLVYLAKNCNTTIRKLKSVIADDGGRTLWLMPEQALKLHLVDHIGIPVVTQEISYGLEGFKV